MKAIKLHTGKVSLFTLTELLVALSIIGVFAGLLMPTLQMAKHVSKRALCVNNIKEIALGTMSYANDNNKFAPWLPGLNNNWRWYAAPTLADRCSGARPADMSCPYSTTTSQIDYPMGYLADESYISAAVTDCPARKKRIFDNVWGRSECFRKKVDGNIRVVTSGYAVKLCRWKDWTSANVNSTAPFGYRIGEEPDKAFVNEFSNYIYDNNAMPDNPFDVVVHPKPYGIGVAREDGSAKFAMMPPSPPMHSGGTSDTFNQVFKRLRKGGEYTSE